MSLLGGLAARAGNARHVVLAPTGLGHLWVKSGLLVRAAQQITVWVIGRLLRGPGTYYMFENVEDPCEFGLDSEGADVTIVGGAGVDPVAFHPNPEPVSPPVKVAVVARMIVPKGIAEAVVAVRLARARGAQIELHLFGAPDAGNPTSYTEEDLQRWTSEPGIFWHGRIQNSVDVYSDHHLAMLLSYREGLPKSLVEAAASGRPIVASNVVGCREVVRDGVEGFLVPYGDHDAVASALVRLAGDPQLRLQMGRAARARFEEAFTEEKVMQTVTVLYLKAIATS
jgi:glycosyltransferase involved in cell wall biosynthesis